MKQLVQWSQANKGARESSLCEASTGSDEGSSKIVFYGLLLFFVLEYTRPAQYFPVLGALELNTLVPVSIFVLSVLSQADPSSWHILKNRTSRWLLFFLFLLGISILTADVTYYSYTTFKAVFGYFLIYYVIIKQTTALTRLKALFATLIIVHIIVTLSSSDVVLHPETRSYLAQGTFLGDGNDFALSVSIVIPLAFFLFQESQNKIAKLLYLASFIVLVLCVIGTQSRGATIALACVFLYQWVKSRQKFMGIIAIVLMVTSILAYAPPEYFERIRSISKYSTEGSAKGRILAWKSAVRMAIDNPLLGVGAGHFPVKYGTEYRPTGVGRTEMPWSTAHSVYFLALGELGFPGLTFLIVIILSNILGNEKKMRGLKNHSSSISVTYKRLFVSLNSSMIAFAVGGAFLSALYYPHIYLLAGLIGSAEYLYENTKCLDGPG